MLRFQVYDPGLCSPQHALDFAVLPGHDDEILVRSGELSFLVPKSQAEFLDGTRVDFLSTPTQTGFKIDVPLLDGDGRGKYADRIPAEPTHVAGS